MSWIAHDLEPYVLQRHVGVKLAILPLILGSYAPDMATKPFVYGFTLFGHHFGAASPAQFQRGWPGVGFTHAPTFGLLLAMLVLLVFRSRTWALGLLVGQWLHCLSDIGDTTGVMLFFPVSTHHVALGAWAYGAGAGRYTDAAAYFSSIGGLVWDVFWIACALASWRVLTRAHFYATVVPADAVWQRLQRRLPEPALLALYRTVYFWGLTRWTAWVVWAHVVHRYRIDLGWGGPDWVRTTHSR